MSAQALTQLVIFLATLVALGLPLSAWMARLADARPVAGIVGKFERALYRVAGVDAAEEMSWAKYAVAVLLFNGLGVIVVFLIQRFQASLPLNPAALANVSADSAFNTAVSFVTNTNWQGYSGESTMSYFTQM